VDVVGFAFTTTIFWQLFTLWLDTEKKWGKVIWPSCWGADGGGGILEASGKLQTASATRYRFHFCYSAKRRVSHKTKNLSNLWATLSFSSTTIYAFSHVGSNDYTAVLKCLSRTG